MCFLNEAVKPIRCAFLGPLLKLEYISSAVRRQHYKNNALQRIPEVVVGMALFTP